jgi:hypothetical protein
MISLIQSVLVSILFLYGALLLLVAFANWCLGVGFRLHSGDYRIALYTVFVLSIVYWGFMTKDVVKAFL